VSNEAYFYLTYRSWDIERPTDGIEKPLHSEKLLVFFAISATKNYGPYYFSTSVNQHNYLEMLKVWFWPKHLRTPEYKKYYFKQDGPPPHTSNIVQEWLASKFGQKFLASDGLKSTFLNFRKRLNLIIEIKGGHIEKK